MTCLTQTHIKTVANWFLLLLPARVWKLMRVTALFYNDDAIAIGLKIQSSCWQQQVSQQLAIAQSRAATHLRRPVSIKLVDEGAWVVLPIGGLRLNQFGLVNTAKRKTEAVVTTMEHPNVTCLGNYDQVK
jgi:hypothetical protein